MKRKEKDFERERVKEAIAECFIKGYTKARTAERVQRYLAELRRCSEQLSRLLGLAAPASRSKKETPQGTAPALVWKESRHYGTDDQAD